LTRRRVSDGAGRHLTLVHAVDGFDAAVTAHNRAGSRVPEYSGYVLEATRQQLASVMPSHAGTGVELHVASGPAAETIRAHAEDMNADLIVMGRSKRFMHLGSTAVRVLRNADRALLVVPLAMAAQIFDIERPVHARAA
jgi:nucleotide-binding universal stress UspA family protein